MKLGLTKLGLIKKVLFISIISLIFIYYFREPISSYFSQDDFFHLKVVMSKDFKDIPEIITSIKNEYAFYRPLSREVFNLIMYKLFGLNSLAFHLVNVILVLINGYLGYKLIKCFSGNVGLIFFAAIIYLFSAVHSIEFYYLASVQTLLSSGFMLLSLLMYINFFRQNRKDDLIYSVIFFAFALLSHESSLVLFPIILLYCFIFRKKSFLSIPSLLPFLLLLLLRLGIFLQSMGLDKQQVYQPSFQIGSLLNTLSWFILWSFGLPEILPDFMTLRLKFSPAFFEFYPTYAITVFGSFLIIIFLLILFIYIFIKNKSQIRNRATRIMLFSAGSFFVSLSPFLFFPQHKFVYYLTFPLIFFVIGLATLLSEVYRNRVSFKLSILIFLFLYVLISYETIKLNKLTYWASKRANAALAIITDFKNKYPSLPKGINVFIRDDQDYPFIASTWGTSSKQAYYILSGSDAFKLIYNDPDLNVYYEAIDKDILTKPGDLFYKPRFPY